MSGELVDKLGEIESRLDALAATMERTAGLVERMHAAWCLEMERERRTIPEKVAAAVGPGTRISWTDPLDASNNAWTGTVDFVGLDQEGRTIAHVDFKGYGRRNLPVDELIIGILT